MKKYEGLVQDEEGDKVSNATITVKDYVGGANSTIYASDVAGSSGSNINGFTNESDGTFSFYATDGYYNIEISKPGLTTKTISNVHIKDTEAIISAKGYLTLQAAIDANPGKRIYAPDGYYSPIVVEDDNTRVSGAGPGRSVIITTSLTGHGVKFYPNNTATTTTFLSNCALDNFTIYSGADKTAGAGVYLLQCNGFRLDNVQIQNHPEGLVVSGGQLNLIDKLTVFATSSVLTGAPVSNSQAMRFCEAPIDGGLYQEGYTCQVTNSIIGTSRCIDKGVRIESCDGLAFVGGYWTGAYTDEVYIKCATAGRYISSLSFDSVYLDGVNMASAPANRNGINIPVSAVGTVYQVSFNNGTIGNYTGKGCVVGEDMQQLAFTGGTKFVNIDNWALDFVGSNTFSEVIVSGCQFGNVGEVTVSTGGVRLSTFVNAVINGNTFSGIGNTGASAITLTGTNANVSVVGNVYTGCTNNITNSATFTGKVEGVTVTFTPTITFATPGDLSVAYSTQVGRWIRVGNMVDVQIDITTSTFTHTTASGDMVIGTVPTAVTASGARWMGSMQWNNITKANYTQFCPYIRSGDSTLSIASSGSGQGGPTNLTAANFATATTTILNMQIRYEVAA